MIAYRKFSYFWSTALLIFSLIVVFYGIGSKWNNPPWGQGVIHPAIEAVIFVVLMYVSRHHGLIVYVFPCTRVCSYQMLALIP